MKKRLLISVVLLASLFGSLPLYAQESCYAEYLREHNMSVLTAEDADDSYDELKKAVLAWQLYGSEASLPLRPKEEPAAPKLQDTTCVIVHLALVDSTWYMWMSVDPLADKYPGNTPYSYCNGNPIMLLDPDGRAIHVAAGAIIGAVIGGTISGISALNNPTQSRRQVLGAIAGGAVSGAITGGAAAATGGLSIIGTGGTIAISAVAGFIGETSGSAVSQGIGNGKIDGGEVARAGLVGAAAGVITGAASKGVSEAVKNSGVVQNIQTKMLDGVKSGTGKAAKQQANQTRKSIINFCSPGNDKQFQMKDLITYPADVVGQEVSTGVTTSEPIVDKTQEIQSNVVDKIGL